MYKSTYIGGCAAARQAVQNSGYIDTPYISTSSNKVLRVIICESHVTSLKYRCATVGVNLLAIQERELGPNI